MISFLLSIKWLHHVFIYRITTFLDLGMKILKTHHSYGIYSVFCVSDTEIWNNWLQGHYVFPCIYIWVWCVCVRFMLVCELTGICVNLTEEIPRLIALSCSACINLLNRVKTLIQKYHLMPSHSQRPPHQPHPRSITQGPSCKVNHTVLTGP